MMIRSSRKSKGKKSLYSDVYYSEETNQQEKILCQSEKPDKENQYLRIKLHQEICYIENPPIGVSANLLYEEDPVCEAMIW